MTYGHHVKANFAPNREICRFPPFLIVVLQRRHQIRNLREILIYLKKKITKNRPLLPFLQRYNAMSRSTFPLCVVQIRRVPPPSWARVGTSLFPHTIMGDVPGGGAMVW